MRQSILAGLAVGLVISQLSPAVWAQSEDEGPGRGDPAPSAGAASPSTPAKPSLAPEPSTPPAPSAAPAPPAPSAAPAPSSTPEPVSAPEPPPPPPSTPSDENGVGEWARGQTPQSPVADAPAQAILRLYVITSRNTYARFPFDVYDAVRGDLVATGVSPDVARGDEVIELRLPPGTYKIVRRGDPVDARVDFATVEIDPESLTDYVIVIDPDSYAFRGAGVVSGELPEGVELAGLRIALTGGAGANLGYRHRVVGTTPGLTSQLQVFGNFSMLYDKGPHHLQVTSDANLTLTDPAFGKPYSSFDEFSADALYSFNINNPFVGPFARAGFMTHVYPGYLYLDDDGQGSVVDVNINHADGTTTNRTFGTAANLDDLRIKLSKPFAPFILQEELGANLKAVDLDLFILDVHIASRIGYGFRQGLTQDLLVVRGQDEGSPITLDEVGDYYTHGPIIGATGKVTFARWLYGAAKFGMMAPLQDRSRAGSNFGERLLIDFSGTAGLKLPAFTSFLYASFDYSFSLTRDGYLTRDTQFDQTLMARLNLKIF